MRKVTSHHRSNRRLVLAAVSAAPLVALFAEPAQAIVYWDTNGAAAGAGATPTGTWSLVDANWNTVSSGIGATGLYGADNTARFAAGTDAVNPYTVTVSGTVNVAQLQIEEAGVPTFTGGILNFTNAGGTNAVLTSANATTASSVIINSQISSSTLFQISRSGTATGNVVTIGSTANNFTGNIRVNTDNTLRLGASGVIPDSNTVTIANASTFSLNGFDETIATIAVLNSTGTLALGGNTLTLAAPVNETIVGMITASSGGKLIKNGAGILSLTEINSGFVGEFVLNAGIVGIGTNGVFGNTVGATLTLNGGSMSSTSGSNRNLSSNLAVNLSGDFTIDQSQGAGALTASGPATVRNSTRTITVDGSATTFTLAGAIGEDAAGRGITKAGAGTLALTNSANTYSGDTTISAGTLNIDSDATLGNAAGTLVLNGGTLNTTSGRGVTSDPVANPINVTANSSITTTSTAAGVDLNLSSSTVSGSATLTFQNNGADEPTDVFQPRFTGSGVNFNPPAINIQNGAVGTTQLHSFNTLGSTQTFANVISGNGSYRRTSTTVNNGGDSVFTAANTYTGGATVADGGIGFGIDSVAGVSGPVGTGTLTIAPPSLPTAGVNAKIFASGGARTVSNPVVFANSPLLVTGSDALTMTGTIDLGAATRTIQVDNTAATEFSNVVSNGGLTKSGSGSLKLSADNTYSGTTVDAGTLVAAHHNALGTTSPLTVNNIAVAQAQSGLTNAVEVTTLTVAAAAKVDLNSNSMVLKNGGGVGSGAAGQAATLQAAGYLKTGLENGGNFDWLGPGISSTQAKTQNDAAGSVLYGLGVIQNNVATVATTDGTTTDESGGNEIYTSFKNETVALNDTLIKFTYMGDADLDGSVTSTDYALTDAGFSNGYAGWLNGDFSYDGLVDSTDYALIDNSFSNQAGPLSEAFQARYARSVALFGDEYIEALAMVQSGLLPEPASAGVLGIAALGLLGRRRRG